MILTLEVIGEHAAKFATPRKVFRGKGGTIGRLPDNDWVLDDPYVSGRHALVRYVNGRFFIEDASTNGVFLNSRDNRLARAQAHPLKEGDVLFIDAYQISVRLARDRAASRDPLAGLRTPAPARTAPPAPEDGTDVLSMRAVDDGDTEWFGGADMQAGRSTPVAPPPPVRFDEPPRAQREARRVEQEPFEALLAAAGLTELERSASNGAVLGELLRAAVGGVMELLRLREQMKDDLRMRGTSFKPERNNPLKFSANAADAFHNLLLKRNPAYLEPAQAMRNALADVRDHQSVLQTAMRIAFEATLSQFDPDQLQQRFDQQMKKGSLLGAPAKMRYWELYRERYNALVGDGEEAFKQLFAERFAQAYEEQAARLRAADPQRGP